MEHTTVQHLIEEAVANKGTNATGWSTRKLEDNTIVSCQAHRAYKGWNRTKPLTDRIEVTRFKWLVNGTVRSQAVCAALLAKGRV